MKIGCYDSSEMPARHVCVIAEMSANHCQDLDTAASIVREVKLAGADVIKTQTYKASTLTLPGVSASTTVNGGTPWDGSVLSDLYERAQMPWEFNEPIMKLARELGLGFLSTVYDPTSVEYLENLGVTAYKISSFELVDTELIKVVAKTGKPLILSLGMAARFEVNKAVETYLNNGGSDFCLLICCSEYPAAVENMNLSRGWALNSTKSPIMHGLSDHSMNSKAACMSVAMGARIIEKHAGQRPSNADASFSAGRQEFAYYIADIREAEQMMGSGVFGCSSKGEYGVKRFRKSLYFIEHVSKGTKITKNMIGSFRPDFGAQIHRLQDFVGKTAARDLSVGDPVTDDSVV